MKVENCPKNMSRCNTMCPEYPCWAYEEHIENEEKVARMRNSGWE